MKKAMIILSIFLFSFSCYAQKFIDPTKVWTVEEKVFDGAHWLLGISVSYKFIGDTIVGNKTYTKLYSSTMQDQSDSELNFLCREDETGKVFRIIYDDNERPIYDFNLTAGDTMKNNHKEMDAIVDSVVIKPFGSVNKKYLYLHLIDIPSHTLTWVDGVGSLFHPMIPDNFWVSGGTSKLICFEENGVLVYHNSEYKDCFFTSSMNINDPAREFKAYPNPVSDKLLVEGDFNEKGYSLELYSVKGELVKTECLDSGISQYRVDVSSLNNGIYILRLITASGKFEEQVIIKK